MKFIDSKFIEMMQQITSQKGLRLAYQSTGFYLGGSSGFGVLILCSQLLSVFSCTNDKLPKYDELNTLRVLTLQLDQPEADAGATLQLTPYLSDINETSALTYEVKRCLDPGVALGAEPICEGNPSAVTVQAGTLNTGDMTTAHFFTGTGTAVSVPLPLSAQIFSGRSTDEQFNGIAYLITYKITNSRGESVSAFKRAIISTRAAGQKNQNPVVPEILSNGTSFTSNAYPSGQTLQISPKISAGSTETYQVMKNDGTLETKTEELTTTWFITEGSFKYYRSLGTEADEYKAADSLTTGRDGFIVAVTRDGRGGVSVVKKCFGACPP